MIPFLLAALVMGAGVAILVFTFRKRRAIPPPHVATLIPALLGGVLVFFVGFGILGLTLSGDPPEQTATRPAAAPVTPPAPASAPSPASVSVTSDAPARNADLQNLAIVAGISENDPELNRQYARLQALCPPASASVGDMVVNLRRIVREESGRNMAITDVMRQLATAQEGGAEAGMTCAETGGMLASLLIQGM